MSEESFSKTEVSLENSNKKNIFKLFSVSLAHLTNDWYMNYLQTILPFLVASGLSISKSAFLISAFTITSSILQPVFGYLVDKKNQRWMVYVGTIWMGLLLSLVGVIHNYFLLLIVVSLSGLGTAAFHPQASSMVTAVSGNKKGFFQSVFATAGNIGWALSPLIMVPFFSKFGLKSSPIFIIPAISIGLMLFLTSPRMHKKIDKNEESTLNELKENWKRLAKIVFVVALRALAYFGLIAFLPLYLKQRNVSLLVSSHLLFIMLFSGAIGGLIGGYLSDRIGRKPVISWSLILTTIIFFLFLITSGFISYMFLAFAGVFLLSSFSVTVVSAQEILHKNQAMASGLMLGFGIGIGGLGVGLVGILAEKINLNYAIYLLTILPLIAGVYYQKFGENR
jgi:MFS transporter, FSR family, fosmidomycin resistance protein